LAAAGGQAACPELVGKVTQRGQRLRWKGARACGRQGCGPGGPRERGQLYVQAPARALLPAPGWAGDRRAGSLLPWGTLSVERRDPRDL